ncbi:hypothetical protein [Flavobacterium sp. 102]|uniref:hypothetical protein n=1 Tax=Flavobacterium sp. 102 TaxID=2135623 RepID=UPI000EB29EB0|nr:hypothetical protein [Flavobacterium sp. 102]RKS01313.1 hypothetical protein C8C84_0963 [Flavobacterium sp. 102]
MFLPINGRIAIIDNEEKEALPLIKILSKNRVPYVFYKGTDINYLPEEKDESNDIRLIFLDINLLNNASPSVQEIKSTLYSVLKRVISPNNFPYSIIFWSKQENEYSDAVIDLFNEQLSDRKPINFQKFIKSDFFPNYGDEETENEKDLITEINTIISNQPGYSYLLNWENQVHKSTDKTLQNVFSSYHEYPNWNDNSNYIINKLGESYSGRVNFSKNLSEEQKIMNAFQAFNNVFFDSLEFSTSNSPITNAENLTYDIGKINTANLNSINTKLLISFDNEPIEYPGSISNDTNPKSDTYFSDLLNNSLNRSFLKEKVKSENTEKTPKQIEVLTGKIAKETRQKIRESWLKSYVVVTPLCDYVQNKNFNHRVVKAIMIKSEFKQFIDDKSEAIFITPKFKFSETDYILVLNFRYFFTSNKPDGLKYISPMFRVRQQLLAEIQSKLARHITRQGVLFIE